MGGAFILGMHGRGLDVGLLNIILLSSKVDHFFDTKYRCCSEFKLYQLIDINGN